MNGIDIVLLALACILVVFGVLKGLVRILFGVAALIAAFALAARYHAPLASRLGGLELSEGWLPFLAYLLIFVGVLLAGGVLAFLVRKLLKVAMLGWLDRLAGAALGLVAAVLLAGVLVLPLVAYLPQSERMLDDSRLAPYAATVGELAASWTPDDLTRRYRERVERLRRGWIEEGESR